MMSRGEKWFYASVAAFFAVLIYRFDDTFNLGIKRVFTQGITLGEALGAGLSLLALVSIWALFRPESYRYQIGDRVLTAGFGRGTVIGREREHGEPVYEIQLLDGGVIAHVHEELQHAPPEVSSAPQTLSWWRRRRSAS